MEAFSPKATDEVVWLSWDFSRILNTGETISSADVTASVVRGVDASPGDILDGPESIESDKVSQKVTGGIAGVIYNLRCVVTTSNGQTFGLGGRMRVHAS